ncbi:unnamed protein product [Thlaspi arvense]|uniref:Response regulatory domain-containing protein n=1 Tax=Thlaspi arvense TaxID=13288 RepID=A0AAU9S2Y2_THLAR|nr:unnamed protein product [Thlaspi arvense]
MFCCFRSKTEEEESTDDLGKNMTLEYKKKFLVLVVDDDPHCQTVHLAIIGAAGGFGYLAENGEEAVNRYRDGEYFNLIIMDNEMPLMDGVTATKMLRDMEVTSVIVGMTSHEDEYDAFMEAGADHCLEKPLTFGKIDSIFDQIKNA